MARRQKTDASAKRQIKGRGVKRLHQGPRTPKSIGVDDVEPKFERVLARLVPPDRSLR